MTYYQEQISKIKENFYSRDYLCNKMIESKNFIDKELSKKISLDDITVEAKLSKFHFIRLFKKNYGRTPYQYLTEIRIVKAKKLLLSGMKVYDVSISVGFDSPTSFTGLFKKMTGTTPSVFQKNKTGGKKKQF